MERRGVIKDKIINRIAEEQRRCSDDAGGTKEAAIAHTRFMTSSAAADTQPTPSSIRSHSAGKRWEGRKRYGEGKRTGGASAAASELKVSGAVSPHPSPYVFT